MPLEISINNSSRERIPINPTTDDGRPAKIQAGTFTVTVSSGDGTVENLDDTGFDAVSGTDIADTTFQLKADGDPGDGVVPLEDVVVMHVTATAAHSLNPTAGAVSAK